MSPTPIPVVAFDIERRHFYVAATKLLQNPAVEPADKALEIESTIAVLKQMAGFEGVTLDA